VSVESDDIGREGGGNRMRTISSFAEENMKLDHLVLRAVSKYCAVGGAVKRERT